MQMVISIAASLVGIIGIVAVVNMFLGFAGIRLEQIFSYVFAPFGFLMGLDSSNVLMEGSLLGNKLIVNEFVAFQDLGTILNTLDTRTGMICAISLCGFANLSSLGICVSGIAVLCPEKKKHPIIITATIEIKLPMVSRMSRNVFSIMYFIALSLIGRRAPCGKTFMPFLCC